MQFLFPGNPFLNASFLRMNGYFDLITFIKIIENKSYKQFNRVIVCFIATYFVSLLIVEIKFVAT